MLNNNNNNQINNKKNKNKMLAIINGTLDLIIFSKIPIINLKV